MKLVIDDLPVKTLDGKKVHPHWEDGPAFENLDWAALGVSQPENLLWWGIVYHLDKTTDWVRDLSKPCPNPKVTDEDRVALFLLVLSDHLAATAGRVLRKGAGGTKRTTVHRLWNPSFVKSSSPSAEPILDADVLKEALEAIATNDAEKIWERYKPHLAVKPEDETAPRDVTSLLSHSELAGKFYRVLKHHVTRLDTPLRLALEGNIATKTSDAEKNWQGRLVRATVRFFQQPARPADLGIFKRLNILHRWFARCYPDYLLFAAGDTVWLFAPGKNLMRLEDLFSLYTTAGLYVVVDVQEASLGALNVWHSADMIGEQGKVWQAEKAKMQVEIEAQRARIEELAQQYETVGQRIKVATNSQTRALLISQRQKIHHERSQAQDKIAVMEKELSEGDAELDAVRRKQTERRLVARAFYPANLKTDFSAPLCEICQVRQGQVVRVRKSTDYVCEDCQKIRRKGFRQRDLTDLLEQEQAQEEEEHAETRTQFLWLKVNLDADQLESTMAALFSAYVDGIRKEDGDALSLVERMSLRLGMRLPSLLRDFVGDYHQLLEDLDAEIRDLFRVKTKARLTSESWVAPVTNEEQVRRVLELYVGRLHEHFPKFIESKSPPCIRLGLSIAPAKFPFYEQWRFISTPSQAVSARFIGRAQLETTLRGLEGLLEKISRGDKLQQTFLNRVAAIERKSGSRILTQVAFFEEDEYRSRNNKPSLPVIELLKSGVVTAEQILAFRKLTDWR